MLSTSRPASFPIPFAANAGGSFIRNIPVNSQIGIQDGAASLNDGFVPENFTPIAAGGVPPFGQDMNGILKQVSAWCQWMEAGGPVIWDSSFSTSISGFPAGAKIDSAVLIGSQWYSTIDGNTTNPDDPLTSSNWVRVGLPVGTPVASLSSTVPVGFVAMNALTIGSAASNAGYARADALFLYCFNWPNSNLPILTSGGSVTTRGANPVADFNANKQLTLPNGKGLGLIGVDTMGGSASSFLSGVPVTSGNATTPGSVLGENLHALVAAENAGHTHGNFLSDPGHTHTPVSSILVGVTAFAGGAGGVDVIANHTTLVLSTNTTGITLTNASSGSGTAHNTVERNMGVFWCQKL